MTIQQLNIELSNALRSYIRERNHIRTGNLYKSIMFKCEDDGDLRIKFDAMFYIKYLEWRQFVPEFFEMKSTTDIIQRYVASQVIIAINGDNKKIQ